MNPAELRRMALDLPEAEEVRTWGDATYRVRRKIFCIHRSSGETASIKATPEQQAEVIASQPLVFSSAAYVARFGWVSIKIDLADAADVQEVLEDAWRRTAPKRLVTA